MIGQDYKPKPKRRIRKSIISAGGIAILITAFTLALPFIADRPTQRTLENNKGFIRRTLTTERPKYSLIARKLITQFPQRLGDLDPRDVTTYIKDTNYGKNLQKGDEVVLPDYHN